MKRELLWESVFTTSGILLGIAGAVFLSLPGSNGVRRIAGIACGVFGAMCVTAAYLAKRAARKERVEEVRTAQREMDNFAGGDQGLDDLDD